jgi:predicted GIY-YIG superfamily endonuclease
MTGAKRIVYILQSERHRSRYYTGLTSRPAARLDEHNAGRCQHTASTRPWRLIVAIEFADEERASSSSST